MDPVKFYTSWFCPFAQRVWIALCEKEIEFEYIEQDPYNKSSEWLAINPKGLVPTLVHRGKSIFESYVCLEYIDDVWPQHPFLPKDPYDRAYCRIWSDFISKKIVPHFYAMLMEQDQEARENVKKDMLSQLETFTLEMANEGPYFCGENLSIVDLMLIPFALRFPVLERYCSFKVPENGIFEHFQKWLTACQALESVKKAHIDLEKYYDNYKRYADRTSTLEVAVKKGTVSH